MTPDQLDQIKQRADKATPGPWFTATMTPTRICHGDDARKVVANVGRIEDPQGEVDATFIAHARADIPALLAYVARLEAENQALKDDAWTMYDAVAAVSNMAHICDTGELCKITDGVVHAMGSRDWVRS